MHTTLSCAVMIYDPLSCKMVVTTLGYHRMMHGVLYITCIVKGSKILVACAWFWLVGFIASTSGLLTIGLAPVASLTCILATCAIGCSDVTCLMHSNSTGGKKKWLLPV